MLVINNVSRLDKPGKYNISTKAGKFEYIAQSLIPPKENAVALTFDEALIFPGLINSHDHLDFNLFAQFGQRIYANYTEWGNHIQEAYKTEIAAITSIPIELRARWGMFKNLLCGVTTVVNHGEKLQLADPLITVFDKCQSLHSVHFQPKWKLKLNDFRKKKLPVVIHTGEGTDELATAEIDTLISWNWLHRNIVGVHGVAMQPNQAKHFKALIWCPQSNYFLLNKTADISNLKKYTRILFGTDSTLTSNWNIWEHIATARKSYMLTDEELYEALNAKAARTWKLNNGAIKPGKDADLVVAKIKPGTSGYDAFYALQPQDLLLVVHQGQIRVFDESLYPQLSSTNLTGFSKVQVNGAFKYIAGDMPRLMQQIVAHNPHITFPVQV